MPRIIKIEIIPFNEEGTKLLGPKIIKELPCTTYAPRNWAYFTIKEHVGSSEEKVLAEGA